MTALAALLLLIVAWSALAFGAVYPWACVPVLVACVTVGVIALISRAKPHNRTVVFASALLLSAVLLQTVPVPRQTLGRLSQATLKFVGQYDVPTLALQSQVLSSIVGRDAGSGSSAEAHSMTIDGGSTREALVAFVALMMLLVGANSALTSSDVRRLVTGIIVIGFALALVGIVQRASHESGLIYGFWKPYRGGAPYGPFVNRNHFAGWMLMAIPLALGDLLIRLHRRALEGRPDWRNRILWLSSKEASGTIFVALAVLTMALSLALTLSRSGILCFAAALAVMGWFVARQQSTLRRRTVAIGALFILGLASAGWAGIDAYAQRFSDDGGPGATGRLVIWRDAARIIKDFPLTGTGLNTFDQAMVAYEDPSGSHANDAHNDYLELASDGGLLVGVPALILLGVLISQARKRLREDASGRTSMYWTRAGAVTALVAIGLQEIGEFSLQIPANTVLFAVVWAIAIADSTATHSRQTELTTTVRRRRFRLEGALVAVGILAAAVSGVFAYRAWGPYGVTGRKLSVDRVVDTDKRTAGRVFTELSYDVQGDGVIDRWIYLDGPRVVRVEFDEDGDAAIDRWEYYDEGERLNEVGLSTQHDGRADTWRFFDRDGTLERIEYGDLHVRDRHVVRVEHFREGKLVGTESIHSEVLTTKG